MAGFEIYNSPEMARELEERYAAGWPEQPFMIRSRASMVLDVVDQPSAEGAAVYSDDSTGLNQLPSTD